MPNNTRARRNRQLHNQRLKDIRPYVNFNYDLRQALSPSAKRKIKTYWEEVEALKARPHQIVRPRRPDRLKELQEFAQHESHLKGLTVAFVPTDGKDKVKVTYGKKGIKTKQKQVDRYVIKLSKTRLQSDDPVGYVKKRVADQPATNFTIQAGIAEVPIGYDKATIAEGVAQLTRKYSDEEANNFFGNWLHGLNAFNFRDQMTMSGYLVGKQEVIRSGKKKRKAASRKAARDRKRNLGR